MSNRFRPGYTLGYEDRFLKRLFPGLFGIL
jgi:hypothetical protein